mmetsp:Transcript_25592/g.36056  ORF Transcript_25592/g.36056 Transcript_25592/m.36056 type:complete len:570 (+) Transcript_25592:99-1808(+)
MTLATEQVRMKAFKKGLDSEDGRRRREETVLQIRKNKKEDKLAKRRAANRTNIGQTAQASTHEASSTATSTDSSIETEKKMCSINDLPQLASIIRNSVSPTDDSLLDAVRSVRRMLSVESNPPVVEVINSAVLPHLCQFLMCTDAPFLQFEAAWALTNVASTQHTGDVVEAGAIEKLVLCLRSPDANVREQAGWCIGNIAGDSADFRNLCLQAGALEPLLLNVQQPDNRSLLGNIVWTISNLCRGKPQPELTSIAPAIPALHFLLHQESDDITEDMVVDVCWAISYICDGENDRIQAVLDANVLPRLMELIARGRTCLITPIVRIFGNFVSGNEAQTQAVIDAGILSVVKELLNHGRKNIRKETCWLLSNIAAGTHDQISRLLSESSVLKKVVNMAQTAEWEVRKEAIWVVSNIFTGGTDNQVQLMAEYRGIPAMCSVLDMEDSGMVMVALEALEKVLEIGEKYERAYVHSIDECDGIDKLEKLQEHSNDAIYEKTIDLIETYFGRDDVEDENLAPEVDGDQFTFGIPSKQLFTDQSPSKSAMGDCSNAQMQPTPFNFGTDFGSFHSGL